MDNNVADQPSETEVLETFAFMALSYYSDKIDVSINELFKRFSEKPQPSGDGPIIDCLAYVVWSYYADSKNGIEINREDIIDWAIRIGKLHGNSSPIDTHTSRSEFELDGVRDAIKSFPTDYPNYKTVTPKLDKDVMPWLKKFGIARSREQRVIGKAVLKHFNRSLKNPSHTMLMV